MLSATDISYAATQSVFNTWRPKSDTLTIILSAILITIIIYQATSTIHDILLGTKHSGVASLRAIHIYLLLVRRSPFAFIKSIFPKLLSPKDRFTRIPALEEAQLRLERQTPFGVSSNTSSFDPISRHSLPFFSLLRLLIVVFAAPIVSIAASILALETSVQISFRNLNFQARATGLLQRSTQTQLLNTIPPCQQLPINGEPGDRSLAQFQFCVQKHTSVIDSKNNAIVVAAASNTGDISILVQLDGISAMYVTTASIIILHDNKLHSLRLPHSLNTSAAEDVVSQGITKLSRLCASNIEQASIVNKDYISDIALFGQLAASYSNIDIFYAYNISCSTEDAGALNGIAEETAAQLSSRVALVETKGPLMAAVLTPSDSNGNPMQVGQFEVIEDAPAVIRRIPVAGILLLTVLSIATILVRIIVYCITRNDLSVGVGLLVRDALGLRCCDSMLPCDGLIAKYGDSYRQDPPYNYGPGSITETLQSSADLYQDDEDHYYDDEHSWNSDSEIEEAYQQ